MQRASTVHHRTTLLEEANAIVEHEFARDLSLDDIARRVASSRRQLQRAYAEIGRTTFREHLTARRRRAASSTAPTGSWAGRPPGSTCPPCAWSAPPRCSPLTE